MAQDSLCVQAMHQDIDFYFKTVKESHPRPYFRYSSEVFDSLHNSLKSLCNTNKSKEDFGFILAHCNKYTDGHTEIYPFKRMLTKSIFPLFDFDSKGNMFLQSNQVISVNGVAASQIANELDEMVSWEYSDIERNKMMNLYLQFVHPFKGVNSTLELKIQVNNIIKDTLLGANKSISVQNKRYFNERRHPTPLTYDIFAEDSIAVIYYNTASLKDAFPMDTSVAQSIKKYTAFLDLIFDNIKQAGVQYLFIDASSNGGGHDFVNFFYFDKLKHNEYIYKSTKYKKPEGKRLYDSNSSNYYKDQSADKLIYKGIKKEYINKEGGVEIKLINKANKKGFKGEIFTIMGDKTYSAGLGFCEHIKLAKIGHLVGEASGQRSPFAGEMVDMQLPNSKIKFTCATGIVIPDEQITDSQGFLQPDIPYCMDQPLGLFDYKKIIELSRRCGN